MVKKPTRTEPRAPAPTPLRPEDVLAMYLGKDVARRVLAGEITRGSGETIRAVIWLCDLRGFTEMSKAMARDELISLLNAYFDCMAEPVQKHGGEVLKFMGDGMLAIFNLSAQQKSDACRAAYRAAVEALDNMDRLNQRRIASGARPLHFGLALHVGEVMYGNIGAAGRLDFTVIGPAVNEANRMEKMCKDLELPLLASETFAAGCPGLLKPADQNTPPGTDSSPGLFTIGC